ncbi:MAG: neutral/alkaline non-lysosomal ceramidase N-terminal domain-containing protein [candidate division Zixibacteria bacterium]|nr:neutral/alkaline non-lysosomal ceramidase N-terminal domain-containing protein [candidate division Zixibacteria bacterium]
MTNDPVLAGFAKIDVTPEYPIRLSGYGVRREETAQVETRLFVRAMALGDKCPALLFALENCGVTEVFTEAIATRLREKTGVERERVAISYTHTHTGPCLSGAAPMLFSSDIPPDHQATIDRYTAEVADRIVEAGLTALADRRAAHLTFGLGSAGFAANRRQQTGPVDHIMPLLRVTGTDGRLRGVWAGYACHCTTLGSQDNYLCGDWAGYAQDGIEREHPGVHGLVSIGCAADANPFPRTGLNYAKRHGEDIVYEVNRLLSGTLRTVSGAISCRLKYIDLPFDTLPMREEWASRAASDGPGAYHAARWLERMDRGEAVPTHQRYPIQTWAFGNDLAVVFLASEVLSDYALRLRRLYDPARLWVAAYCNAFPGYIPSRRIWREGGYEGGDATLYFGMPARYAEDIEEQIVSTVKEMLPIAFRR